MLDRMEMTIADDDSERTNFIKEGHGELHYANQDLCVQARAPAVFFVTI